MNPKDLAAAVKYMLWTEAKRLLEYDPARYGMDVVDDSAYAKRLDRKAEAQRMHDFSVLEYNFGERAAAAERDARAVLLAATAELRAELLPVAKLRIRQVAKEIDATTRKELRKLVAEHKSSDDAVLFAYLTMQDLVRNYWECEGRAPSTEDRFADEVAESTSDYDGAADLAALLRVPKRYQVRDGWRIAASFDTVEEAQADAVFKNVVEGCSVIAPRYVVVDVDNDRRPARKRARAA